MHRYVFPLESVWNIHLVVACKYKQQLAIKRCKHFELGGEKKTKGQALQF